ncbi:MAG TPA: hypothetical protein VHP37_24000 [Burkholderiales bacterium]|nr:hypothetical protein [Burkholderiales bacterium]
MAKMSAPAPDERRAARSRGTIEPVLRERPGDRRPADPALDPDMQDLVQRFELGYAELAPSVEEAARQAPASDAPFPEIPDIFGEPSAARPGAESARVFPMPRREIEAVAATPAWPRETPGGDRGGDVDLDEAMAILRASEQRAAAPPRTEVDEEPKSAPRAWRSDDVPVQHADVHASQVTPREAHAASATSWASRSHGMRTFALVAAVAALVVGAAAGYFLGRSASLTTPSAVIESSAQGGTQLKLDRQLHLTK